MEYYQPLYAGKDTWVGARETPNGLRIVKGLYEAYKDKFLRNKVVLRTDAFQAFRNIFSSASLISHYRTLLLVALSGEYSGEDVSKVLQALYKADGGFRLYLGELYYFGGLGSDTFYDRIREDMLSKYFGYRSAMDYACASSALKYTDDSEGYIYFSLADDMGVYRVPGWFELEVVSRAKIWDGRVQVGEKIFSLMDSVQSRA